MPPAPAAYDLHLHTYWSYDALAAPASYFERARELGVRCLAVTEHHNIDSFGELVPLAAAFPDVRWIPAAELSVQTSFGPVDLLCYGLPVRPAGALADVLAEYHQWQNRAGATRIRALAFLGLAYDEAEHRRLLQTYRPAPVLEKQGLTPLGGPMETDYLRQRGFITRPEDRRALARRLPPELDFPPYPAVTAVVPAVRATGALVVLAHPTLYVSGTDRRRLDALRAECHLDGIECAHPKVPPELTVFYRAYCRQHQLVSTGGSDCHRSEEVATASSSSGFSDTPHFAAHLGEPAWLDEFLERLD